MKFGNDAKQQIPVILDTDIGSDIDDAIALTYLLSEPRCKLLGITTVTGEVEKRSCLCGVLCDAAGRSDIPIYSGISDVLVHGPGQPNVPQYEAIANTKHRSGFPNGAIRWLGETILSRPGEITLLAIGPMTNVAALFAAYPETPRLLRQVVLMCGVFTAGNGHGPGDREWNARCDPVATFIVYKAQAPRHLSVGLEVTTKCKMDTNEFIKNMQTGNILAKKLVDMTRVWLRNSDKVCFHDPLAAMAIFEPDLLTTIKGTVSVEFCKGNLAGLTTFKKATIDKTSSAPHEIAVDVNRDRFFQLCLEKIANPSILK